MKKLQFKNYFFCVLLLFIAFFTFLAFFIIDLKVFNVKETLFTAFYGYCLFPIFSFVYARLSYGRTKQIIIPNIIYLLFCSLFIIFFVKIGSIFGAKYKSKAEFTGGVILILLGLKMLLEGLGVINF
jgi:putative Mn2+ efflux pump MntP